MAPIVAPGVCRFTLEGVVIDRPWAMVLDIDIDSGGVGGRDDNIRDQAQVLLNEWIDHIRASVNTNTTLTGVSWTDLDSLTGSTGFRSDAASPRVMPSAGTVSGDSLSGGAAALIHKAGTGGRGRRGGRIFLTGLAESQANGNQLAGGTVTSMQAGMALFLSGINQSGATSFGGYDSQLVVVHAPGGTFVSFDHVDALVVQARLATQRRRLRG